jgi:hypothetical protein
MRVVRIWSKRNLYILATSRKFVGGSNTILKRFLVKQRCEYVDRIHHAQNTDASDRLLWTR